MSSLPTGTVTFLFTDIEGSTRLALEHPDAWESLRKRHHAILQSAIEAQNGYVFQVIGDAFCAAFHNAGDALQAAVQSQVDLFAESWGDTPVKVRMGIHSGKADVQADGQYIGYAALSRVQRVMSAGHGGQMLLSQAAQELVRDDLPEAIGLRDLGERRLKDLSHPEHLYQVDSPALPTDFPALKTLDVQLNNLPVQLTSFVGRTREIAAVVGLLRLPDVRLVTLTGAGGSGKSRLSLQVGAEILDEYEDGVWFIELAAISDPDLVLLAIAATLKVKESPRSPLEQALHAYLAQRQLLLVIDNFEQVVSAAPVIGRLLGAAPKVKVLVSSREVLRLRGEHDYPVPPLGLPEATRSASKQTPAVLAQYEAIALYIQHARAANPAFELTENNASSVAEICQRLDGLPLAIELAAARSRLLKPAALLEKLKSRLTLLTGGARDLPGRQQTMRSAIDWSYELLEPAEKTLFARLGVFSGGWTIESAESVCGQGLELDVLSGLESLLDKSLLRQMDGKSGEPRFTMLETIREYAFEKLSQSGELLNVQQAHADLMVVLVEKVGAATSGPEEGAYFARLDDEQDNLRAAIEWTLARNQPGLILKADLYEYWSQRANIHEPLSWLERAIAMEPEGLPVERARAMKIAGNLLLDSGEYTRARRSYESALGLFRQSGDQDGIIRCLNNLGILEQWDKHYERARQLFEESLAGQDGDSFGASLTMFNLGGLAQIRGDFQTARDFYLRARGICARLGAEAGISYADGFLTILALIQRDLEGARENFERYVKAGWIIAFPYRAAIYGFLGYMDVLAGKKKEAQPVLDRAIESLAGLLDQNPHFPEACFLIEGKARLELENGLLERAAQLFGAAWTQRADNHFLLTEAERLDYEPAVAVARAALGAAAFDQAFAKGQAMTLKEAVHFAVNNPS